MWHVRCKGETRTKRIIILPLFVFYTNVKFLYFLRRFTFHLISLRTDVHPYEHSSTYDVGSLHSSGSWSKCLHTQVKKFVNKLCVKSLCKVLGCKHDIRDSHVTTRPVCVQDRSLLNVCRSPTSLSGSVSRVFQGREQERERYIYM